MSKHNQEMSNFERRAAKKISRCFYSTKLLLILAQVYLLAQLITTNCDATRVKQKLALDDQIIFDTNSLYESNFAQHTRQPLSSLQRLKRSSVATASSAQQPKLIDACQSKMEVLTPYYATNNKGKLRTVVNSELMQQAIQVETCVRSSNSGTLWASSKCNSQPECGCEQKYKWHRLLVMDPNEANESGAPASRGLFMDWFLFPSNCVCRCRTPPSSSTKLFLKTMATTHYSPNQSKLGTG